MHPLIPLIISHALWVFVGTFLPPLSAYRRLVMILILINCALSLHALDPQTWWSSQFAMYVYGFGLNANYFINLRKPAPPPHGNQVQRMSWAVRMCFNSRLGIAKQDLPGFHVGDAESVPSRATFLMQRGWKLAWTMGGLYFVHQFPLAASLDDFRSSNDHMVRQLSVMSLREWRILTHFAFMSWFDPYCFLAAVHSFASVVAVACGDRPGNWRPLFGHIREAYSVQRYFGVFWHKLMRKAFTGHASFLVHDVMGMRRGTAFSRSAILLTVFLISGVMHAMIPPVSRCEFFWQVAYYGCVGITIALENFLGHIVRHYQAPAGGKEVVGASAYWRTAGYLWTLCFHLWTTAKFDYPLIACTLRPPKTPKGN